MKLNVMMLSQEAFNFEMKSDDDFGSVLKKYMEEQKLSVNELAKKMDYHQMQLSNIDQGIYQVIILF